VKANPVKFIKRPLSITDEWRSDGPWTGYAQFNIN
jgi:hypothetical protein